MKKPLGTIIANISIKSIFVILAKAMAFITVPIVTRALGPEIYGKYNMVLAIALYVVLPGEWGFLAKGIREVADEKSKSGESEIVSDILSARIVLCSISCGLFALVSAVIIPDIQSFLMLLLSLLYYFVMVTYINFFFYGSKDVTTPSIAHFIGQFVFLVLVVLFIKTPSDSLRLLSFMIVMAGIESLYMFFKAKGLIDIKVNFSPKRAWLLFKQNFRLGLGLKIGMIQNTYPVIIIPLMYSQSILGNYSAAYKVYLITVTIMQIVVLAVSPYIVKIKRIKLVKRRKYISYYIGFSILSGLITSILIYVFSGLISRILFGDQYTLSTTYLRLIAVAILPFTPLYVALCNIMNNLSIDKEFLIGGIVQGLLIIIATPLALYFFRVNGLIIVLGITMLVQCAYYMLTIKRRLFTNETDRENL